MIPIDIANGFYVSDSLPISNQECVNWYPSIAETKQPLSLGVLFGTSGIEQVATSGVIKSVNRGQHVKAGKPYFLNGTTLHRLDRMVDLIGNETFVLVSIGTIPGETRASFADNGTQLMIIADNEGYIIDETSGTPFLQITDVDFKANGLPEQVMFDDSFFLVTTDTKKWIKSAANDGLSWNALDSLSAESDPDPIVGGIVHKNKVWIAGSETIEAFENRGLGGFPYQRTGLVLDKGVFAPFSLVRTANTFMFVGGGVNESAAIWALNGGSVSKVSTDAIDSILNQMSPEEISGTFAYSYAAHGAYFVGFTFSSRTFEYNEISKLWNERKSQVINDQGNTITRRWRANSLGTAYNRVFVGDSIDGRIGSLDNEVFSEYGNEIIRTFSTIPISNQGNALVISKLELTLESGVAVGAEDPQIRMSVSRDGKTFNNEISRGFGRIGEYFRRTIWHGLGRISRYGVIKFVMSDPVKPVIIKLEADILGMSK